MQIENEEAELFLFSDDLILYVGEQKGSKILLN